MTAQEFLSAISQLIYLALFVISAVRLIRLRSWVAFDTFLFFGVITVILLVTDAARLVGAEDHPAVGVVSWVGIAALPYLLLRLADDFQPRRWTTMLVASLSVVGVVVLGIVLPQPWPLPAVMALVAHFVVFGGYASFAFLRESRRAHGGTRRRMQAVALGSALIALVIALAGVTALIPSTAPALSLATQVLSLAAVVAYFVGFAPPAILQRGWQEPAIRSALASAAELLTVGDPHEIGAEYAAAAIAATGAQGARIGLWDEARGTIEFRDDLGELSHMAPGEAISGRAFVLQKPVTTSRAERDAPERAEEYRRAGIRAIVSAPVTSGDRRLGVLTAYAVRPPFFTDDVVSVLSMLAEQAALVLRTRELLHEAAQVQAMGEMTRMKDDFLSVVAHDVRTPLTTILINSELLRNAFSGEDRNARRAEALHSEAMRLKQLVEDYLDVVRSEHDQDAGPPRREVADLAALVRDVVATLDGERGRVEVDAPSPVRGSFDTSRIRQLIQNLVSNALKYSDASEKVAVSVADENGEVTLRVRDHGIGIPEADIPLLFERFHRGANADDRRYRGLGLGLYIVRQVAQEHGGDIAVSSRLGEGTTFTVRLGPVAGEPVGALASASGEPMESQASDPETAPPADAGGRVPGNELPGEASA
ncbi:MAG TPA: GAF domain-containing sensor histidine kinase [Candidatus Limnocylindria bacterium]|nr:GAF domain-containing sensor histidine kinase [Candidatus Limnocylindria bacterium]